MGKVGYIYDDIYLKHLTGEGHPERPERLIAIEKEIKELKNKLVQLKPRKATAKEIGLVHDIYYPQEIMDLCSAGGTYLDADTRCSVYSYEAASYAVGAGLVAVDKIKEGKIDMAFGAVRPPGHHAEYSRAMGFCLFNNIAITARYAQQQGFKKVFIIDFDAHHGNGTQKAFYDDNSVFYFSTHQYPFYPGTGSERERGTGKGLGYTYNIPLPAETGDETYNRIYTEELPKLVRSFQPEIILVSAGYDLHRNDPLALLNVSTEGVGNIVKGILNSYNAPFIFLLEGGYDLKALAESVRLTLEIMVFHNNKVNQG